MKDESRIVYDLAISFGPGCSCSQTLRDAEFQYLSLPFDWIGPSAPEDPGWALDVRTRTDLITSEFKDWLRAEDFEYNGPHVNGKGRYFNTRHRFIFYHDFPLDIPFEKSLPAVAAKYRRRSDRLLGLIRAAKRVLVMRVDRPDLDYRTPVSECQYAIEQLSRHFPGVKFEVIVAQLDVSIPFEKRLIEEVAPGVTRIAFDFLDRREGQAWQPRRELIAKALREIARVPNYCTREELAAHKAAARKKRWAKYGATNYFQYHWRKLLATLGLATKV